VTKVDASVEERVIGEALQRGRRRLKARRIWRRAGAVAFVCIVAAGSLIVLTGSSRQPAQPSPTSKGHVPGKASPGSTQKPSAVSDQGLTCSTPDAGLTGTYAQVSSQGYELSARVTGPPRSTVTDNESTLLSLRGHTVASLKPGQVVWDLTQLGRGRGFVCIGGSAKDATLTGLVGIYLGGAHGPELVQVLFEQPDRTFRTTQFVFEDVSVQRVAYSGGSLTFFGFDPRMAYAWAAFAFSGFPLLAQAFRNGHLVDVTKNYPALVRQDAAMWLKQAKANANPQTPQQDGAYSAWAEDECRLEPTSAVWRALDALDREGKLNELPALPGRTFVTDVERTLLKNGVCAPLS
jgi:hypothetical protein